MRSKGRKCGAAALVAAAAMSIGIGRSLPARAKPHVAQTVTRSAIGAWWWPGQSKGTLLVVFATETTSAGGLESTVGWARGVCGVRHQRPFGCSVRVHDQGLAPDALEIDPLMGSASVRFHAGGRVNRIRWAGGDVTPPGEDHGVYPGVYPTYAFLQTYANGGVSRAATATGTLLGRRLSARNLDRAVIGTSSGTRATVCAGTEPGCLPMSR